MSRGNTALTVEHDEEYENEENVNVNNVGTASRRKSLGGGQRRRSRSSFGGIASGNSPKKSSAEQARLAEMYKTVIKLSSENKINAKNSWGLDLIDHMGKMIRDDAVAEKNKLGVNFQKASCTLDASIKIYANRVDDTWTSSFRVLENLSRNGQYQDEDDDDDDNDDDADGQSKGSAKVGSKSTSKRLGLTDTIERNPASLNAPKLENNHAVDPMFHKMSLAFDEGGAKGMLMTNLRVGNQSSTITFNDDVGKTDCDIHADGTPVSPVAPHALMAQVDVTDLVQTFKDTDVLATKVCPTLDYYRDCLGVKIEENFVSSAGRSAEELDCNPCDIEMQDNMEAIDSGSCHDEHNSDDLDTFGYHDSGDGDHEGRPSTSSSKNGAVGIVAGDIQWGAVFGEEKPDLAPNDSDDVMMGHFIDDLDAECDPPTSSSPSKPGNDAAFSLPTFEFSAGNDYSFFGQEAMSRVANLWAGSRHWKFANRITRASSKKKKQEDGPDQVSETPADGGETGDQPSEGTIVKEEKPKKKGKEALSFDFKSEWIPENFDKFSIERKSRTDTTTLTAGAVQKALDAAEEGALLLPPDAKMELKDLFRLFLQPQMLAPHRAMARVTEESAAKKAPVGHVKANEKDFIWGKAATVGAPSPRKSEVRLEINDDDIDIDRGYCDDDHVPFGDDDFTDGDVNNDTVDGVEKEVCTLGEGALAINMAGMVRADRKVEKVDIGYAKIAKRVNVRKLKTDLWSYLDSHCEENDKHIANEMEGGDDAVVEKKDFGFETVASTTHNGVEASQFVSFQQAISDIARDQKQKEVTLPFYFISLLHLANDKTLKIEAQSNLADLVISKDE